ncbi:MAG: type II toxin-antitoxin system RelE/ParE family toxin [Hoeflea sp.]|uniref:type II toxin-antitoxin system RelE/ParE family toxin n=1 Tax=Hoeflea sp. TaxID=1940281 RepID=UPI002731B896|nr:type II toxin-antitoxin system RelE/ParE family toxin [Hoeflea sp.]MDP2119588.1 type II toxin-antitoxin system RelE/ParE family toxin [Hoeflea sp.]
MTAKPYRIEWRPMARDDLRAIVHYIGKDNPTRAKSFGQELRDKTKPLAQHPELGRQGRPGLPDWLRELVVHPNYIVFYRVLAEARTVEILRVKHAAQQTQWLPTPAR